MLSCRYVYTKSYIHVLHWEKNFQYLPTVILIVIFLYQTVIYKPQDSAKVLLMDNQLRTSDSTPQSTSTTQLQKAGKKTGKLLTFVSVKACSKTPVSRHTKQVSLIY